MTIMITNVLIIRRRRGAQVPKEMDEDIKSQNKAEIEADSDEPNPIKER